MSEIFYDAYLSYSSKDAARVRRLAERLRADNIQVWFDEWEIKAGEAGDIPQRIEEGLEDSRIFILVMSPNAFKSDWVKMELNSVLFRDPMNKQRRFVPLLLDDCHIPVTIRRYKYIDWRDESEQAYQALLRACKPSRQFISVELPETSQIAVFENKLKGHEKPVVIVVVTPDDKLALSGSYDGNIKIWDLNSGNCLGTLTQHLATVWSIAITRDGKHALSGSFDRTLKLWDISAKVCLKTLEGHNGAVMTVAITPDGNKAISGSQDKTIKLWDLTSGNCLATFEGHNETVLSVALTPDGKRILSGSVDKTIKFWDIESRDCIATFQGHQGWVRSIAIARDGQRALSGAYDGTLKLWDIDLCKCLATFEGHHDVVECVAISPDNRLVASASRDRTIKIWDIEKGICLQTIKATYAFEQVTFSPQGSRLLAGSDDNTVHVLRLKGMEYKEIVESTRYQIRYSNAKVVLMGQSQVGKSALAYRLVENRWFEPPATHGMQIWPLKLPAQLIEPDIEREVWLWDLAGQPEYRIIHQLFFDQTDLALILFDSSRLEEPFYGLSEWEQELRAALKHEPVKLLVATKADLGSSVITVDMAESVKQEHGYSAFFKTSAKTGTGCQELLNALSKYIPWQSIPWTSTFKLFKAIKDELVQLKEEGVILIRYSELRQQMQMTFAELFRDVDLHAEIRRLASQGLVKPLEFGDYLLLQPDQLNNYASAVICAAGKNEDGIGCISRQKVLAGAFDFNKNMKRLDRADEEIMLLATLKILLDRSLCISEETASGEQLIFPYLFNREMPELTAYSTVFITCRFSGQLETIYSALVVRLVYSGSFDKKALWKEAAEFLTQQGKTAGFIMNKKSDGVGEIKIFFEAGIPEDTRVIFIKYIHELLLKRALNVEMEREYVCPKCNRPVKDRDAITVRIRERKKDIHCSYCDKKFPLNDLIERKFYEKKFAKQVQKLNNQAEIKIDNENKEIILIGNVMAIAGQAGQIYRLYANADHGIDGEIEFKDNSGHASGQKVYLQLKSGDSYLYWRQDDEKEIFTVKKAQHLQYWQNQAYPVYLVIRTSDEIIRWMNVTEYLQQRAEKDSKQIIFEGDLFTAASLIKLREKYISSS
jgi:small GTP-binding protein